MKNLAYTARRYLRDRLAVLIFFLVYLFVFAMFCWLAGMPLSSLRYACILCLAATLLAAAFDFMHYAGRHALMSRALEGELRDTSEMPKPYGLFETDDRALLKKALETCERVKAEAAKEKRAQIEYTSLWAHQIKVPIAAMRLLMDSGADAAKLGAELLRIEQYVEMTLGYARLNGSASDYVLRRYAVSDIMKQAARRFAPLFIQKKLRLDFRETGLIALTDEKWLVFVLEQLLSNAVKYTKTGCVRLYADEAAQTLTVEDTGIGIAAEDLPRVFEQGYTGYNGRGDKRATGLGLYLCRQTLHKLGHSICIQSTVGKGTKVTIGLMQTETKPE